MSKYKKSFNNPRKFRDFTNSPSQLYDYQMSNIMDGFYDNAMTNVTEGSFKAVVLSGIKTEDGSGTGTGANDATIVGNYINIIHLVITT